jgi:hypothetical protein
MLKYKKGFLEFIIDKTTYIGSFQNSNKKLQVLLYYCVQKGAKAKPPIPSLIKLKLPRTCTVHLPTDVFIGLDFDPCDSSIIILLKFLLFLNSLTLFLQKRFQSFHQSQMIVRKFSDTTRKLFVFLENM